MIAHIVRTLSSKTYRHPGIPQALEPRGPFRHLKMAVLVDHMTEVCLAAECRIRSVTPKNYRELLQSWKPDLLFVESAFHGTNGSWRYELAKQPRWLRMTRPTAVYRLVDYARSRGVPAVFWNKDDGSFFEAFIDVAKHFDHIFTTDINCVPRYRQHAPPGTSVHTLMIPCQPRFHSFTGFHFTKKTACFMGSYYRKILDGRRAFLDMFFSSVATSGMPLDVYDRNHDRFSHFLEFRFPKTPGVTIHPKVSYWQTADLYKAHTLSLNVNSVTDSESMCSRRLLEILACGGIVMTNPGKCVDKYFRDYCHVVSNQDEALELLRRMKHGPSSEDLERAEAGARYVHSEHTWAHRLQKVCEVVNV